MKKLIISLLTLLSLFLFTSCNQKEQTEEDKNQIIYNLAVRQGFLGDYDDWLENIKGENGISGRDIELTYEHNDIKWRYVGDTNWNDLYRVDNITGSKGETGKDAFEIYKQYYPEYDKSEDQWIKEIVNGTIVNKPAKTYIVEFKDENNNDLGLDSQVVYKFGTIDKPGYYHEKEGYELIGWQYNNHMWDFDEYLVNEDMVLRPVFRADELHVYINWPGDDESLTVKYGDVIDIKPRNCNGMIFDHFEVDGKEITMPYEVKAFTSIYPIFITKSTVTLDPSGGTLRDTTVEVNLNKTLEDAGNSLPSPKYDGHLFLGWYYGDILVDRDFMFDKQEYNFVAKYAIKKQYISYIPINETECKIYNIDDPNNEITIPSEIDGYKVVELSSKLYKGYNLKKLSIPNTIRKIGERSFGFDYEVSSVYFDGTLEEFININKVDSFEAFRELNLFVKNNQKYEIVTDVTLNMPEIPSYVFGGIKSIKNITLGNDVKKINPYAFYGCPIYTLNLGNGVEELCENALNGIFSYRYNGQYFKFKELIIPKSVKIIHQKALYNCEPAVKLMVDPDNPIYGNTSKNGIIEKSTKKLIAGLKDVDLTGVKIIGAYSLANLYDRYRFEINIPEGVEVIEDYAFLNSSIYHTTLPKSLVKMGTNPFLNTAMADIVSNNERYVSKFNNTLIIDTKTSTLVCATLNATKLDGFKIIGKESYFGSVSPTIGDSVVEIAPYGFTSSKIGSIYLNKIQKIGHHAFENVVYLDIIATNNLKEIGERNINEDTALYYQGDLKETNKIKIHSNNYYKGFIKLKDNYIFNHLNSNQNEFVPFSKGFNECTYHVLDAYIVKVIDNGYFIKPDNDYNSHFLFVKDENLENFKQLKLEVGYRIQYIGNIIIEDNYYFLDGSQQISILDTNKKQIKLDYYDYNWFVDAEVHQADNVDYLLMESEIELKYDIEKDEYYFTVGINGFRIIVKQEYCDSSIGDLHQYVGRYKTFTIFTCGHNASAKYIGIIDVVH